MKQVVVFPRGQLAAADKKALREAGIVPVEADDPSLVVTVLPMVSSATMLSPDVLTMALLRSVVHACDSYPRAGTTFVGELEKRLLVAERARQEANKP